MIHDLHGWVVPRVVVSSDNKELHIGRWYIYLSTRHTGTLRYSSLYLSHMRGIYWGARLMVKQG